MKRQGCKPTYPLMRNFQWCLVRLRDENLVVSDGVLALYAALRVHEGEVFAKTEENHMHVEFLGFLEEVYEKWGQSKELHIVMDNFNAYKTLEVTWWVEGHKSVHFHFTPTHASWLNQVELWFGILL